MSCFRSFDEFYPHYLAEHRDRICRRLHFIGSTLFVLVLLAALLSGRWAWLWLMPLAGYGCAWIGHYVYEKTSMKRPL